MRTFVAVLLLSFCGLAASAQDDWPDFRGPWRDGRATAPGQTNLLGLPLRWSETENVKWKTAIPDRGWSTPVILNGQIWLTTATIDGHDFFAVCVDQETGKILFNQKIFHCDKPESLGAAVNFNCYASPSAVLEPGRVYVNFGSYGTACLDAASFKVLWQRDDLPCRHFRGPGSSPIIWNNLLILTFDGIDLQYVAALDKITGKTVWKTDRTAHWTDLDANGQPMGGGDYRKAFSTPIVVDVAGGPQMLAAGSMATYGYDPVTGRELWRLQNTAYSPASRPLFDQGLAIFATGNGKAELEALRPDGRGELSSSAVVWKSTRAVPSQTSGTLDNGLLFMVNEGGIASCFQTADGAEVWRERIGGDYSASVLYGDGRIYCCSREGKITVLKAGREFAVLATNELAAGFMASPAVSGHALYLRTKTDLYRIEEGASK
ncbi:MAG TPA: PQQ-binding-like beta-propeller repeat protein [Verrucomicrobiae bacterium]|jgi:outer membrane protein assembly factor BamB|nr:PQQ-binding-like beta-propeller repeat protein [Verrucomicrobiae bacterium]